jgi:predicted SprT family Zn-dependent metalloprotease
MPRNRAIEQLKRQLRSEGKLPPSQGQLAAHFRHELALNPDGFVDRTDEQICSTLVHEMAHVWQQAHGSAPSRGYHNRQWAAKMKSLGLQPSSTGMPGGSETGYRVSHYIIPGGAFTTSFQRLAAKSWKLNLQSAHQAGPNGDRNSKTKFSCAACGQNAWGKPDLAIICKVCGVEMKSADANSRSYELAHPVASPSDLCTECTERWAPKYRSQ